LLTVILPSDIGSVEESKPVYLDRLSSSDKASSSSIGEV
jgi:hypothetical protein